MILTGSFSEDELRIHLSPFRMDWVWFEGVQSYMVLALLALNPFNLVGSSELVPMAHSISFSEVQKDD